MTLTLTLNRVILHMSCITRRPLPTDQISLKSKKLCVDGRTDGRTYGHLRPTLLGRLGGVDLITNKVFVQLHFSNYQNAVEDGDDPPRLGTAGGSAGRL